jgi:hypothetical protein
LTNKKKQVCASYVQFATGGNHHIDKPFFVGGEFFSMMPPGLGDVGFIQSSLRVNPLRKQEFRFAIERSWRTHVHRAKSALV